MEGEPSTRVDAAGNSGRSGGSSGRLRLPEAPTAPPSCSSSFSDGICYLFIAFGLLLLFDKHKIIDLNASDWRVLEMGQE